MGLFVDVETIGIPYPTQPPLLAKVMPLGHSEGPGGRNSLALCQIHIPFFLGTHLGGVSQPAL